MFNEFFPGVIMLLLQLLVTAGKDCKWPKTGIPQEKQSVEEEEEMEEGGWNRREIWQMAKLGEGMRNWQLERSLNERLRTFNEIEEEKRKAEEAVEANI